MFGKKCSLCGGKLNSRGICTECGLDNSKTDKNYRINQSECDGMPLTHIHDRIEKLENQEADRKFDYGETDFKKNDHKKTDYKEADHREKNYRKTDYTKAGKEAAKKRTVTSERKKEKTVTYSYGSQGYRMNESENTGTKQKKYAQTKDTAKRRRPLKIVIPVIIAIVVLGSLYDEYKYDIKYAVEDAVQDIFQDTGSKKADDTDETDYDHYQYVTREIPEEGESADYELTSGNYVVGVEIPEGIYTVTPEDDYDTVQIDDPENSIYLYEYTEGKKDKIEDIRLYKGAVLTLKCKTKEKLHTDNAQDTDALETAAQNNPLTEAVEIKGQETLTAGRDFEPGIYDLSHVSGDGNVDVSIYSEEQEQINSWSQYLSEDGIDGNSFHYLVIPQNATVEVPEGLKIKLTPAERIASTDYYGFYNR